MEANTQAVIATVSRVNNYIKRLLDSKQVLNDLWVKGEISNFKRHSSGHIYLTLKDEHSVLKAVMFRSAASTLAFSPSDGMKIVARGRVSVYEAGGAYQLYIEEMIPDGVGALYLEYERLKKSLAAEGLFDERHKKPIPRCPSRIGVVTAPTGAAVRDIINVATRRFPMAEIVIYPALVQGAGAKESIVAGIEYFNREGSVDTLIVGRGGGSIEDLWAFNEECVARAIFASRIPVISAVGHEVDFTIADFVADMRAPTPSAAAEISVPSAIELQRVIALTQSRMLGAVRSRIENAGLRLKRVLPGTPQDMINGCAQRHDMAMKRIETAYRLILSKNEGRLGELCARLNALSPLNTLARGYAIPTLEDGTVLKREEDFVSGTDFDLRIRDGAVKCMVK
ncbi:MAG TPA: exodeoxyribonuclease VII large subunit [Candidatus Ornithomonoglobus merdipullorum]|uniref:Exodeoxyribonuclease 7 large subunit n=1 Tax=Candidatus Ornithomonoglobus merdipullorum TaxID=2840895 RepID=A0A9D1SF70_9FIRM|nr:exodeoxyribonuclease VII large subunit [Candidatus Ornithomonoglobus merdipullorum]